MRAYSYYAYAALRAWFSDRMTAGCGAAAQANYEACCKALESVDANTRLILKDVYCHDGALGTAVRETARKYDLQGNDLWTLVARVEKDFAIARGLI